MNSNDSTMRHFEMIEEIRHYLDADYPYFDAQNHRKFFDKQCNVIDTDVYLNYIKSLVDNLFYFRHHNSVSDLVFSFTFTHCEVQSIIENTFEYETRASFDQKKLLPAIACSAFRNRNRVDKSCDNYVFVSDYVRYYFYWSYLEAKENGNFELIEKLTDGSAISADDEFYNSYEIFIRMTKKDSVKPPLRT